LGTEDDKEADKLVADMNKLLGDESYWTPAAHDRALKNIDPKIVSIFYDDIDFKPVDPWLARDAIIPLPDRNSGYSRVLFLGTTGSGKTTLVRQLIGSNPRRDRFPSTSTAKTTVFDIEIILSKTPYRAVVSFLSRDRVRNLLTECLMAAVIEASEGGSEENIARRLLEHSEQRFRLSYLLGILKINDDERDEEDEENAEDSGEENIDLITGLDDAERTELSKQLQSYIQRIKLIAASTKKDLASYYNLKETDLSKEDKDTFLELLEDAVQDSEDAQELIDAIQEDIESRFKLLTNGKLELDRTGWPLRWQFETEDRDSLIKSVNQFSGNYAKDFGRLLTPLVEGMRVAGPFRPIWHENQEIPTLVLMDTEGLGHTPNSASSLPTSITRRFDSVDVILLVDNATQPAIAGAQAVLRNVVASGHESKLIVTFTHFDQVRGDNLPNAEAKRNHVKASLENAIRGIEEIIRPGLFRSLSRQLIDKVFYVENINEFIIQKRRNKEQLTLLLAKLQAAIVPPPSIKATPIYDLSKLILTPQLAAIQFQESWDTQLQSEHWTRVKALTRRLGYLGEDSYDTLRPIADLIRLLQEEILTYIASPDGWEPVKPSEDMCIAATDQIAQEFFSRLHKMVPDRLWSAYLKEWQQAYDLRGPGTGNGRKQDVRSILDKAAPVPKAVNTEQMIKFLEIIHSLFKEAVEAVGGRV
jgi:hypothetical protein